MARSAPGKHRRRGLSLVQLTAMFPDDATAEQWFVCSRWPHGPCCPGCDSDRVAIVRTRKPQPYRCRDCRMCFSVKTGTLMQGSNLGCQTWAIALYLLSTGLKGTSSMKLHRDVGITQKSAWHLAHRIRETWRKEHVMFSGPVEVDETYVGGTETNKHASQRLHQGGGTGGKVPVVGAKDRATNRVMAEVVNATNRPTLQGFVRDYTVPGAAVYTDDALAYRDLQGYAHASVKHSAKEYVNGQAHTNGVESFWSMLKRGYHGTFHHLSEKHLGRYVGEFSGRHNIREAGTLDQMTAIVKGLDGKRLRYRDLVQ